MSDITQGRERVNSRKREGKSDCLSGSAKLTTSQLGTPTNYASNTRHMGELLGVCVCGVLQVTICSAALEVKQSPKQENRPVGDIYTHTCPPRILANTHTHTHTHTRTLACVSVSPCVHCMCVCVCAYIWCSVSSEWREFH